jgi:hypothetical protein
LKVSFRNVLGQTKTDLVSRSKFHQTPIEYKLQAVPFELASSMYLRRTKQWVITAVLWLFWKLGTLSWQLMPYISLEHSKNRIWNPLICWVRKKFLHFKQPLLSCTEKSLMQAVLLWLFLCSVVSIGTFYIITLYV